MVPRKNESPSFPLAHTTFSACEAIYRCFIATNFGNRHTHLVTFVSSQVPMVITCQRMNPSLPKKSAKKSATEKGEHEAHETQSFGGNMLGQLVSQPPHSNLP